MNGSISSEVASYLCATGCTSRWPFAGVPLLPLFQPIRQATFLAVCGASHVSYTAGIHCRLGFSEDFFGPSLQECRPVADDVPD
jgi:hypothetical protein